MEVINLGGLEEIKINLDPPASSSSLPGAELLMNSGRKEDKNTIQLSDIDCIEKLNHAVNQILSSLSYQELHIKEAHDYAQILPEKYSFSTRNLFSSFYRKKNQFKTGPFIHSHP